MPSVTHSLTIIAADADTAAANAYFDAIGWGTPVLSVPLSPDGNLPITHYGCHYACPVEIVSTLQAAKDSTDPTLDVLDTLYLYAVESQDPQFEEALVSSEIVTAFGMTLARYYPPFE